VKQPQIIVGFAGVLLVASLYYFGKTEADMHKHETKPVATGELAIQAGFSTDSMLSQAKSKLKPEQVIRLNTLENSISRGDVKEQQMKVYHQLSHFWSDSARVFEPYAWYEAQAARLENSEKSLIFAARLFLGNIRQENNVSKKKWIAQQAKELYERSLSVNPSNDSAKVELGISLIYGDVSGMPMAGIQKIKDVLEKDSTNGYALMAYADALIMSTQYDKAIDRLNKIASLEPTNLDAILKLADAYTMIGKKKEAIEWYEKSLSLLTREEWKEEVRKRIKELK
jgi:tetratricopeptide (TPR) repeat protein